jgi:putative colanic acid biosynthesis glycosyltransferase
LKVLHINTAFGIGGAASAAASIHDAVSGLPGVSSEMVVGRVRGTLPPSVHAIGMTRAQFLLNVLAFRLLGIEGAANLRSWRKELARVSAAQVIHLHNAHGYYLPDSIFRQLFVRPLVWTLHDYWLGTGRRGFPKPAHVAPSRLERIFPSYGAGHPIEWIDRSAKRRSSLAALVNRQAPIIVVPTHDMAGRLAGLGLARDMIEVIPHGIFADGEYPDGIDRAGLRRRLELPLDQTIILFVAAHVDEPRKGWSILADAASMLPNPDRYTIVAIGDRFAGPAAMKGFSRVIFTGPKPTWAMADYYRAADVFVSPSLDETFGLTIAEALGYGIDVICSDLDVYREVASEHAMYFQTGSARSLADTFARLRPAVSEIASARMRTIRDRFSTRRMALAYGTLYDRARATQAALERSTTMGYRSRAASAATHPRRALGSSEEGR